MAQKDLLAAHLHDTTSTVGVMKKVAKVRTTTLWVVGVVIFGIIFSFAQMRQRDKSDAEAAKEGKIPTITLSTT
jgi:hypothetical protein